jgi:hypothetical protein
MNDLHSGSNYKNATPVQKLAMDGSLVANSDPATAQAEGLLSDEDIKGMAEQALAGDPMASIGIGRGKAGAINFARFQHAKEDLMRQHNMTGADLAKKDAEFYGYKAGERSLGTREATIGMAVDSAKRLAPMALAASAAVDRSSFLPIAMAEQLDQRWQNNPALAKFNAANLSFVSEYTAVMNRGGVPTENAREHAFTLLQTAYDKEAYAAVVGQLMQEMNAVQHAPQDVMGEFDSMYGGGQNVVTTSPGAAPPAGGGTPAPGGGGGWSIKEH